MGEPNPPFISLYVPDLQLYLTSNTFIKYRGDGDAEKIGLILSIEAADGFLRVREFLSWYDIRARYNVAASFSCWPADPPSYPKYLCDTDIVSIINTASVLSLAFVFVDTDTRLQLVHGIANTYRVTSFFSSFENKIYHRCNFEPFPSSQFKNVLPSCFPSLLFNQIMCIQDAIQQASNTRSMNSKNVTVVAINNISPFTWRYITIHSPGVNVVESKIVTSKTRVVGDACIVEKCRVPKLQMNFVEPAHLAALQSLFGQCAGIGVRFRIPCQLGRRQHETSLERHIRGEDCLNVVPFDGGNVDEMVRRGIELLYFPKDMSMKVKVRFRQCNGRREWLQHLRRRGIGLGVAAQGDEEDIWPLHRSVTVGLCQIKWIDLASHEVQLCDAENNTSTISVQAVIERLAGDLFG